ncbi:MAG TPA: sulfur carrier protein ThiS [Bacteroidales bacterium]|nr:sulfur carrier protein ThiS [Bacteroidales bacterium]
MKIILNNNSEEFDKDKLTISELLELKKYSFRMLVIKVNNKLIRRHEYEDTTIQDGDNVTVLHLISGG